MTLFKPKSLGRTMIITLVVLMVAITTISLFPLFADAQTPATGIGQIKGGITSVAQPTGLNIGEDKGVDSVLTLVGTLINTLLTLLGAAFLILVLYAGGTWMFAMGDEKKVKKARDMIKTASIGLAVIVLSFFIVNLVINIIQTTAGGTTADKCGGACVSPKQCKESTAGAGDWACR